jgi:hypothetical protein
VTRAQFGTILSRVLWGQIYSAWIGRPYFERHLEALKAYGIMKKIVNPEFTKETRGNIMLMLTRAKDMTK